MNLKGGEKVNTATITNMGNNIAIQPKGQQQTPMQSKQIFGHVFGQILSNQQVQKPVVQIPDESQQNISTRTTFNFRCRITGTSRKYIRIKRIVS